jgi:3-dehydroquinate dehydratase-2
MYKALILNGPNLNKLGTREPEIYGNETLSDLENRLNSLLDKSIVKLSFFQSNHEGDIIDKIGSLGDENFDGLIMNPASFTHTSIAIADSLSAIDIPYIEVHISNIYKREEFRKINFTASKSLGVITGFGFYGYQMALMALIDKLDNE